MLEHSPSARNNLRNNFRNIEKFNVEKSKNPKNSLKMALISILEREKRLLFGLFANSSDEWGAAFETPVRGGGWGEMRYFDVGRNFLFELC